MRYLPIQAASQERVPISLWGRSRIRTVLAALAASAAGLVPAVMVASPAQAVASPSNINNLSVSDAGNWEGGSITFKLTYTGSGPGTYSFATADNGTDPGDATGAATLNMTDGSTDYDNSAVSDITFPGTASGQSNSTTVTVATKLDDDDADETFTLVATDTNGWTKSATGTIWAAADDSTPNDNYGTFTLKAPTTATPETATKNSAGATVQKTVRITATLTKTLAHPVTIPVSTIAGTANSNKGEFRDFDALPAGSSITIAPYSYSGYIDVTLFDDAVHESPTQSFSVAPGTTYGPQPYIDATTQTKTVSITDDDAKPSVSIGDPEDHATEGEYLTFPVTLSAPSELPVSVTATPTGGMKRSDSNAATAGDDFDDTAISVTIPQYTKSGFASVPTSGDADFEGPENIKVTLSGPDSASTLGTPVSAYGIIDDDDTGPDVMLTTGIGSNGLADLTSSGTYLPEGATGEATKKIKVTIPADASDPTWQIPIKIDYAFKDGTATNGTDYKGTAGSITIPAGTHPSSMTLEIPVTIIGDAVQEGDEDFDVVLTSSTKTLDPGDTTITLLEGDDDKLPTWSVGNATVVEGNTGTITAKVPVMLSAPAGADVTFDANVSDGTAIEGGSNTGDTVGDDDYDQPAVQSLTIKAGQTVGYIEIPVKSDVVYEQDETIVVAPNPTAGNASITAGALPGTTQTGAVTITNDDSAPKITFNNLTGTEGSILRVNGSVDGLSQYPYQVGFTVAGTAPDAATTGKDFDAPDLSTYTLNVARGKTGQLDTLLKPPFPVDVYLSPDTIDEATETFTVTAKETTPSPKGFTTSVGTYKITDDPADMPPAVSISDESIDEDEGSVDVHVKLTATGDTTGTEQTIKVPFYTADGSAKAGQDYAKTEGTVTFDPGKTETMIKVPIINDKMKEGKENFWVKLGSSTMPSGVPIAKGYAEIIINANDGGSGDDTDNPGEEPGDDHGAPTIKAPAKIVGAVAVPISGKADADATVELWGAPMAGDDDLKKIGETKADEDGMYSFSRWIGVGYRFAAQVGGQMSEETSVWVQQNPVFVASSPSKGKLSVAVQGNPRGPKQTVIVQRWVNGAWVNAWKGTTGSNNMWKASVSMKSKSTVSLRAFVAGYTPDGLLPGYTATKKVTIK
jgi:hypothetical protein